MIFLYRFDVIATDGVLTATSNVASQSSAQLAAQGRLQTYLLTNGGVAVATSVSDVPFLPPLNADQHTGVFLPAAIDNEQIRLDGEKYAGQMVVSLPLDHDLAQRYALDAPALQTWLTVYQFDNTTPAAVPLAVWVGRLISVEFDETRAKLTLFHLQKVLSQPGLTGSHPRACGHLVYDQSTCGIDQHATGTDGYWAWREDGMVTAISADGMTITVDAAANRGDGFFSNGYLVLGGQYTTKTGDIDHFIRPAASHVPTYWPPMGVFGGFRRSIVAHSGSTVVLNVPLPPGDYSQAQNARVSLYAGCDGALSTCKGKFNNKNRFGGYPYIPIKNPFEVGLRNASGG